MEIEVKTDAAEDRAIRDLAATLHVPVRVAFWMAVIDAVFTNAKYMLDAAEAHPFPSKAISLSCGKPRQNDGDVSEVWGGSPKDVSQ
jgi:hypothetical protein